MKVIFVVMIILLIFGIKIGETVFQGKMIQT